MNCCKLPCRIDYIMRRVAALPFRTPLACALRLSTSRYTLLKFSQHLCSIWWHRLHTPSRLSVVLFSLSWSIWCSSMFSGVRSITQMAHVPSCLNQTSRRNHRRYFWECAGPSLWPPLPVPGLPPLRRVATRESRHLPHAFLKSAQSMQYFAAFPVGWNTTAHALHGLGALTAFFTIPTVVS